MMRFVALVLVLAGNAWSETLFSDNFDGAVLDANKWNTTAPFLDSTLSVQDGYLSSLNRGIAITKDGFSGGYTVSGSFSLNSLYDIFNITLRSDGQITPSLSYGVVNGVTVGFWGGYGNGTPTGFGWVWADEYGTVNDGHLWTTDLVIGEKTIRTFSIFDSGSSLTVSVDNQQLFSVATTFAPGDKIAVHGTASGPNLNPGRVDIFDIQVVPEPSSFSLLLAGGVVFAAVRRRKVD